MKIAVGARCTISTLHYCAGLYPAKSPHLGFLETLSPSTQNRRGKVGPRIHANKNRQRSPLLVEGCHLGRMSYTDRNWPEADVPDAEECC